MSTEASVETSADSSAREDIEQVFAAPSTEHSVETYAIAQAAKARWNEARLNRLTVAERIADRAAFDGTFDPADLASYRKLYAEQLAAKQGFSLAADELIRAVEACKADYGS